MIEPSAANTKPQDIFYTSQDGLRLYARRYGAETPEFRPVICLAGLTRNSRDFESLALSLSQNPVRPRTVYCLDYRGRGQSDYDENWRNYSPLIELIDVLDFMTIQGLRDVAMIGTSRGGIIAMMMAVLRPSAIGAAVLNDIGPVIETAGLARIMGYAGKVPLPSSWQQAANLVRDMNRRAFTQLTDQDWEQLARQWFNEESGRPAPGYDSNIGRALEEIDISKKIPEMWPHFKALSKKPVLVLRGENSDLLSPSTVSQMQAENPAMVAVTIQGQGHAPLLKDRFSQRIIADFLTTTDTKPSDNRFLKLSDAV